MVEHIIRNDGVRCSSHLSGTIFFIRKQALGYWGLVQGLVKPSYREFACFVRAELPVAANVNDRPGEGRLDFAAPAILLDGAVKLEELVAEA